MRFVHTIRAVLEYWSNYYAKVYASIVMVKEKESKDLEVLDLIDLLQLGIDDLEYNF